VAGPLDIDDDIQRMLLRKSEAAAQGRDRAIGPEVARGAVTAGPPR